METDVSIADEIYAYGMLPEPLFQLIGDCENRPAMFFMTIKYQQKFESHLDRLAAKYSDLDYVIAIVNF
jgi:hypothetical protein